MSRSLAPSCIWHASILRALELIDSHEMDHLIKTRPADWRKVPRDKARILDLCRVVAETFEFAFDDEQVGTLINRGFVAEDDRSALKSIYQPLARRADRKKLRDHKELRDNKEALSVPAPATNSSHQAPQHLRSLSRPVDSSPMIAPPLPTTAPPAPPASPMPAANSSPMIAPPLPTTAPPASPMPAASSSRRAAPPVPPRPAAQLISKFSNLRLTPPALPTSPLPRLPVTAARSTPKCEKSVAVLLEAAGVVYKLIDRRASHQYSSNWCSIDPKCVSKSTIDDIPQLPEGYEGVRALSAIAKAEGRRFAVLEKNTIVKIGPAGGARSSGKTLFLTYNRSTNLYQVMKRAST